MAIPPPVCYSQNNRTSKSTKRSQHTHHNIKHLPPRPPLPIRGDRDGSHWPLSSVIQSVSSNLKRLCRLPKLLLSNPTYASGQPGRSRRPLQTIGEDLPYTPYNTWRLYRSPLPTLGGTPVQIPQLRASETFEDVPTGKIPCTSLPNWSGRNLLFKQLADLYSVPLPLPAGGRSLKVFFAWSRPRVPPLPTKILNSSIYSKMRRTKHHISHEM